ncbi:hypothetical protein HUG10_11675 [Halorarum halophilum]|uniref:Uncharacterized protein n=1 Tax=Halorarum halophilum TaxID=2743090 RepID=A0A7D5GLN7_9EURY|nr:hypothetical protein [Halobaculum halophilum]QLG28167.1 hypothetical protein HUG10_11675 [Halobaculum halophilum]
MTSVQTKPSGRIASTIPKGDAVTLGLTDEHLSWHVESRDRLRATPEGTNPKTSRPTTVVRYDDQAGSFTVTIPRHLAYAMHIVDGELDWDVQYGSLYASVTTRGGNDE